MTLALLDRPPTEAEQLDLFALPPRVCTDCGKAFQTSRPSDRCALCSSLRTGLVGPATVECLVCGAAHQVAVLSPTKLCDLCRADLVMAESNVRADLGLVQDVRDACWEDWVELHGAATPEDQDRYSVASEARKTGMVRGKPVAPATIEKLWADATQKGDGLSTLLEQHDICIAADRGLTQARHRAELALREIEAAR